MAMTQLGDARSGKFSDNLIGFGRALRRAGVPVDSARIALAHEAAQIAGLVHRTDFCSALEAVMVACEQDRAVFRELFDAYFRDPEVAHKLLAQMLPSAQGKAEPSKRRPRVSDALSPPRVAGQTPLPNRSEDVRVDAAMTATDLQALRHADFGAIGASEFHLVQRLVRDLSLPVPVAPSRRTKPGRRGGRLHWSGVLRQAHRSGGEIFSLPRLARRDEPLPLLVVVDVSGSMERYARLLLSFLHAALRQSKGRHDIFAFGTKLTDLTPAFRLADTDSMLSAASVSIDDYAGGTRLGECLATLRVKHSRRLVGRRTVVLFVSDGLDTGEPASLERELVWLRLHSRRVLWLNPLLRFDGYQPLARGAAALHRQAHGMLAVHNIERLEDLAASLAAVLRR